MNEKHIELLAKVTNQPKAILTGRHRLEIITPRQALQALQFLQTQIDILEINLNEANSNLESAFILHRSLEWKLNKANAELDELKKPVVISGEPLREKRCDHEWKSFETMQQNGSLFYCTKCNLEE